MSPIKDDSGQWELHAYLQWKPVTSQIVCTECNGNKQYGGGFGDPDGPIDCRKCSGSGVNMVYPNITRPEMPKGLQDHMHRAWMEFFKTQVVEEE